MGQAKLRREAVAKGQGDPEPDAPTLHSERAREQSMRITALDDGTVKQAFYRGTREVFSVVLPAAIALKVAEDTKNAAEAALAAKG
jgi:hypothetical protein